MKRTIGLIAVYLLQIILLVLFLIPSLKEYSVTNLSFLVGSWDFYKEFLIWHGTLFGLDKIVNISSRLRNMFSALIFNAWFTIIYSIIAKIIVKISEKRRRKKLSQNNISVYTLSEEEKAKFNYKLYEKRFSLKGALSFLIPTIFTLFILLVRFDKTICENYSNRNGFFDIYNNSLRPFLISVHENFVYTYEAVTINYIEFIDRVIEIIKIEIIEYILIFFLIILFYILWSVIVLFVVKINRKRTAQRRAKRARNKYIAKMEKYELSVKQNSDDRISSKASEILGDNLINSSLEDDASSISIVGEKYIGMDSSHIKKQASYIDDISTGVTDLGIAGTGEEENEPIERKIPIFVGDEDVEISLDKEPFVEIEEEEVLEDYDEEMMPFFEKYSPELMDYSYIDESLLQTQVEVIDESVEQKEEVFASVKEFEETDYITPEKNSVQSIEVVEDNEVQTEEPIIKEKVVEVVKIVEKVEKKKKIKPIEIKKRTSEERFKNAKKKYLVYKQETKLEYLQKKRNLIRRKYKR